MDLTILCEKAPTATIPSSVPPSLTPFVPTTPDPLPSTPALGTGRGGGTEGPHSNSSYLYDDCLWHDLDLGHSQTFLSVPPLSPHSLSTSGPVPIQTPPHLLPLRLSHWFSALQTHPNQQWSSWLLSVITYGFRLGFVPSSIALKLDLKIRPYFSCGLPAVSPSSVFYGAQNSQSPPSASSIPNAIFVFLMSPSTPSHRLPFFMFLLKLPRQISSSKALHYLSAYLVHRYARFELLQLPHSSPDEYYLPLRLRSVPLGMVLGAHGQTHIYLSLIRI